LQLNMHRLGVFYRVRALDALDASPLAVRLERWRIRAEPHRLPGVAQISAKSALSLRGSPCAKKQS
jgi:hypothetical protein